MTSLEGCCLGGVAVVLGSPLYIPHGRGWTPARHSRDMVKAPQKGLGDAIERSEVDPQAVSVHFWG